MMRQRTIAFLMLTLVVLAAAYMSKRPVFPAVIWAVAAAGFVGRVALEISRPARLAVILAATIVFVIISRIAPEDAQGAYPLSTLALTYVVAWYFMLLMGGSFFVRHDRAMPRTFPLYAVAALICSGNVFARAHEDKIYMMLAMAFAVLTALYFSAERRYLAKPEGRKLLGRRVISYLVCLAALLAAGRAGAFLGANQYEIDRAISSLATRIYPGSAGFSDEAVLRSILYMKTRASQEPALRVFSHREPGYLRGGAFFQLLGPRWVAPARRVALRPTARKFEGIADGAPGSNLFALGAAGQGPWEAFEVHPAGLWSTSVFCPSGTTVISAPVEELRMDWCGTVMSPGGPIRGPYTAFVPARGKADKASQEAQRACRAVPPDLDRDIRALAERLFKGCTTTRAKIAAVEEHFTTNYKYRLGIRVPPGVDPLTYFLLERPAAHCEFFAAGATVLLRLGGVPAYYATGFVVTEKSPYGGYWIARHADAHAWAEACDEHGRWVTVEATPAAGVPSSRTHSNAHYLWDSLAFRLQRFVATARREGFSGVASWCLARLGGLLRMVFTTPWDLVATACAAGLAVWLVVRRLRRLKPRPCDPLTKQLHRALRQMDRRVRKLASARSSSETLTDFARRLQRSGVTDRLAPSVAQWYLTYVAIRYGGSADEQDVGKLRRQMPRARPQRSSAP